MNIETQKINNNTDVDRHLIVTIGTCKQVRFIEGEKKS